MTSYRYNPNLSSTTISTSTLGDEINSLVTKHAYRRMLLRGVSNSQRLKRRFLLLSNPH